MEKTLIVVTGPTAVGKTRYAIELAQQYGCDIINADSRQIFRHIPICTAAPTAQEQALVRHHFVEFRELDEYYSAAQFETDVMALLPSLWERGDHVVMCGGSMMYVDAVCNGIDNIPDISPTLRAQVLDEYNAAGLEPLLAELERLDPAYYAQVDRCNPRRVIHAIEVCRQTGVPYSTLRTGRKKQRDFKIVKIGLNMERSRLFDRINRRVDLMMEQGLVEEARSVYHLRHLNSLNTVGMKEMFAHFDGTMDLITARERIKKNTRVYAKKQLTWLARDPEIEWKEM
ncbi:tRNA (adenosine(37)-N6)-dimethylallyltransferase MiaA [Sodaliphilus sp.]|uniref:tRNA (adenosine(37)-N6)-dimethylallyltransferase MiaA n=1 Tax=Sodaliphilus sp. TaxID=2815818 RepID=UPI0038911324